jgi:crotonobetainyl-CoA:carnitine CoA-transferase CaiB-like acyl-CoA transferase
VIVAVGSERLWRRFCQALDIEESIGKDPRFTTNADRLKHREALIARLEQVFATQDAESWLRKLRAADIPCGPINEVDEALTDPQIIARDMIVEQTHSTVGTVRSVGNPVHLSETPVSYRLPPPTLGQHTAEVLAALGYTPEAIASLRNRHAI